jgi:hypothetical protein
MQKTLIQELLYLYHDDQLVRHWDVDNTKELLERRFYWPGLDSDKGIRSDVFYLPKYKPYETTEYDAILVVVDCYTKMAWFIPTTTELATPKFAVLFHDNNRAKIQSPYGYSI